MFLDELKERDRNLDAMVDGRLKVGVAQSSSRCLQKSS